MCIAFKIGNKEVKPRDIFNVEDSVVIAERFKIKGDIVDQNIYWENCVAEDVVSEQWLKPGKWKRADIYATEYCQAGRWYSIPKGFCLKGIALETFNKTVIKIITRDSRRLEKQVQDRFAVITKKRFVPCEYVF